MKNISLKTILGCTLVALIAGCGTAPTRIEAGGPNAITTMGVDILDFKDAAGKMVESLLVSDAMNKVQGRKAIILVGKIRNDTPERFDVDQVAFKITTDLNKSQKTQTLTTFGDKAIDTTAQSVQRERDFLQDKKISGPALPDYSLAGKILYTSGREGRMRSASYTFQLYLTDTATGLAVWQEEKIISKQGTRPAVSF